MDAAGFDLGAAVLSKASATGLEPLEKCLHFGCRSVLHLCRSQTACIKHEVFGGNTFRFFGPCSPLAVVCEKCELRRDVAMGPISFNFFVNVLKYHCPKIVK